MPLNFPINDDWIFVLQIKAFLEGDFLMNALVDPVFIFQGLLGLLWVKVFGFGFTRLHILGLIVTAVAFIYFLKTLKTLTSKKDLLTIASLLFIFNPLILAHSYTFMTDNFFLCLMLISVYHSIRFLGDISKQSDLYLALLAMLAASLIRQPGILLGLSLLAAFVVGTSVPVKRLKNIFLIALTICIGIFLPTLWSRYGQNNLFIEVKDLQERIFLLLMSWPYFIFSVLPLVLGLTVSRKSVLKIALYSFICILLGYLVFQYDIFATGNVLYIEGLYSKSGFRTNFSVFDNVPVKLFLSFILSFGFVLLVDQMWIKLQPKINYKKIRPEYIYLGLSFLLNFAVLFITSDLYDRYYLPSIVLFLLLIVTLFEKEIKLISFSYVFTAVMVVISVTLNVEFLTTETLKWKIAQELADQYGITTQISVNDTYKKYMLATKLDKFTGLEELNQFDSLCFVQQYTTDPPGFISQSLNNLDNKIRSVVENPKPYGYKKDDSAPRIKNNLPNLIYNEKYKSAIYGTVGKSAYVGAWCSE